MWLNIIVPPQESLNFLSLIKNSETLEFLFGAWIFKVQLGICFEIAKWCQEQQLSLMFTVIWALEEEK